MNSVKEVNQSFASCWADSTCRASFAPSNRRFGFGGCVLFRFQGGASLAARATAEASKQQQPTDRMFRVSKTNMWMQLT
jgi:hypothetical protein